MAHLVEPRHTPPSWVRMPQGAPATDPPGLGWMPGEESEGSARDRGDGLLRNPRRREMLGRNAQQRVHDDFLVFTEVSRWLALIADTIKARWP